MDVVLYQIKRCVFQIGVTITVGLDVRVHVFSCDLTTFICHTTTWCDIKGVGYLIYCVFAVYRIFIH